MEIYRLKNGTFIQNKPLSGQISLFRSLYEDHVSNTWSLALETAHSWTRHQLHHRAGGSLIARVGKLMDKSEYSLHKTELYKCATIFSFYW